MVVAKNSDGWMPLTEAAQIVYGESVPAPTLHGWATAGLKGIRLQVKRIGVKKLTKPSLLRKFQKQVDALADARATA